MRIFKWKVIIYLKSTHIEGRVDLLLCCVSPIAETRSIPSYDEAFRLATAAIYDLLGTFKRNKLNLCINLCFFIATTRKITDVWFILVPSSPTVRDMTLRSVVGTVINGEYHFWDLRSYKVGDTKLERIFSAPIWNTIKCNASNYSFVYH
jgi:hypothetical protein